MSGKLVEYFNKQPRLGSLSTASKEGKVNAATFGSIRMIDEKTATMGLGNNRTLAALRPRHGLRHGARTGGPLRRLRRLEPL